MPLRVGIADHDAEKDVRSHDIERGTPVDEVLLAALRDSRMISAAETPRPSGESAEEPRAIKVDAPRSMTVVEAWWRQSEQEVLARARWVVAWRPCAGESGSWRC